jgi:hypothetical protein
MGLHDCCTGLAIGQKCVYGAYMLKRHADRKHHTHILLAYNKAHTHTKVYVYVERVCTP